MTHIVISNKYLLAIRRPHEIQRGKRNLYNEIRKIKKMKQTDIAHLAGISAEGWRYREREKEVYRLGELCALRELLGMDWVEFGALIEKCA